MNESERTEVLKALRYVDEVVLTGHERNTEDMSVVKELEKLKPDVFANGGDRKAENIPEYEACNTLGIKMIFNVGGEKTQSSSELVRKVKTQK